MPNSLRNQPSSEDQRNVIIATVLVAVIMFVWMFYIGPTPAEQAGIATDTTQQQSSSQPTAVDRDTAGNQEGGDASAASNESNETGRRQTAAARSVSTDSITAGASTGTARRIVVETDLYTAVFSSKGATLERFTLKEYQQYNQKDQVEIVDTSTVGAIALAFTTPSSRLVDSRDLYFTPDTDADTIRVTDENRSLTFSAGLGEGSLQQTYTFHPDDYDLGLQVEHVNATSYATQDGYELIWDGGLPFSEGGSDTEQQNTGVFARSGGEVESITVNSEEQGQRSLNGEISWLSVKNKYFTAAILPDEPGAAQGADLVGSQVNTESGGPAHSAFVGRIRMPTPTAERHTDSYHLYLGPLNYQKLASYDRELYDMVDYGWDFFEWMTRPLATFFFIPMLTFLGDYMPYGVVVILMAVAIKTVVYPLTKSSYRSMAQMRELQPRMEEIREKYDDDPEKQQEEMMKLYRETGVNPLGGCLPMLLQYPVIIALYQFIPQSIQLRQKSFLWAQDLSAPDVILNLPFTIPFYGDYVAGFTLLMGLSMLVTMRLQSTPGSAGGQMKVFMYAMPAVIFFIFNRFASALSLYYLFYNIVTAVQQKWINYQLEKEKDEEETEASNGQGTKKDAEEAESQSFFQKLMQKAEEAQKRKKQQEE